MIKNNNIFDEIFPLCSESICGERLRPTNRFNCKYCSRVFCSEHFKVYHHKCEKKPKEKIIETDENLNKTGFGKCADLNCQTKLHYSNKFDCIVCKKTYCLSHRFDFSHDCVKS